MKYLIVAFLTFGLLVACSPKTTEIVEVAETTEVNSTGTDGDMPKADIGEGKLVFINNCIDCHYGRSANNVQALVDSYSKEKWDKILPKMIVEAELDEVKARQVSAYIYWEIEN